MISPKLQILIIEDNLSFLLELEMLVQEIGYEVVAAVDNSTDALEVIFNESVDFILMDIDIKGKLTGIEIAEKIKYTQIPILFLTSFGDETHYEQALKSNFAGYLVKPIDKYSLRTFINLTINNLFLRNSTSVTAPIVNNHFFSNYIFLKKGEIYYKIEEEDIAVIKGADDYVSVHLRDQEFFLLRKTLKTLEDILQSKSFFRIHRSYLINLNAIDNIDFNENILSIKEHRIPLSRRRKKDLEKILRCIE